MLGSVTIETYQMRAPASPLTRIQSRPKYQKAEITIWKRDPMLSAVHDLPCIPFTVAPPEVRGNLNDGNVLSIKAKTVSTRWPRQREY